MKAFAYSFAFIVLLAFSYLLLGIVVIQPIGGLPDGASIVYLRAGTGLPFIQSPDGHVLDQGEGLSLLSRGMAVVDINEKLEGRRLFTLPYIKSLYLASTDGVEFAQ